MQIFLCVYYDKACQLGGGTQIYAVLELLERAITTGANYQYLHFFQGSDLPIKSQDAIHDFFSKNNGKQFVMIEKSRRSMAENKAWYRHYFCDNRFFRKSKIVKCLNFSLVYIQKKLHIRKNIDINLYQGSALFSITGDCGRYVLSRKDEIRKRFHLSLAPDEVFLQSILMDSPYRSMIENVDSEISSNARLIDRTRPDGKNSPHIWRKNEFDYIINQPEDICFARKFDEKVDFEIVDKIYNFIES